MSIYEVARTRLATEGLEREAERSASQLTLIAAVFVAGVLVYLTVPAFRQLQADSFRDLYLGRWIWDDGLPHREVFALENHGQIAVVQQWLADWISYVVWRVAGYQGLAIVNAIAFASAYALLAGVMRMRKVSLALAISFATFAAASAFTLVFIRAQTLSLPLFPALLWLCLADDREDRLRWRVVLLVPLLVLWANLHGSVLLGAALAICYLGYRAVRMALHGRRSDAVTYAVLAAVALATVVATPYGIAILHYYKEFAGNAAMRAADIEWDPPAFPALSFFQFVVPIGLAVVSSALAWRRGVRPSLLLVGATFITAIAAALAMRNNVWLGMAAAVLVADTAKVWIATAPVRRTFAVAVCVLGLALGLAGVARLASETTTRYEVLAPIHAIDATATYVEAHPCARVLADILSVSALLWRHPQMTGRVAYDGQLESYSQPVLRTWVNFQLADTRDWAQLVKPYQVLLASKQSAMLSYRLAQPGAVRLADDSRGVAVVNGAASRATSAGSCGAS